ncbi:MAG: ABC transporter ATP-binding protein [Phycisphaerae bacterium]|nr:ABC transporter ATP-binding protein [Phycisphaerae bacterium]
MTIEAEKLTIRRLGRTVLRDVSLRIGDGECLSIIGPNGAGKSTLMGGLLGLIPAAGGGVSLDGLPLGRFSRREIARRIAYVPQIHEGYLGFRVRDVVETGRYAHVRPLDPLSDVDHRAISEAVEACRVGDLLDRTVDTLSGGERQKVWIAAALAQQAPAMFLDEPTSALDPAHQAELIRIMRHLAGGTRTLVVICHDLNLPIALGGRVVAVREGRTVFDDRVEALLDTSRLRALFGTEFVLHRGEEGGVSIQLRV